MTKYSYPFACDNDLCPNVIANPYLNHGGYCAGCYYRIKKTGSPVQPVKTCKVCGAPFYLGGPARTCSVECSEENKHRMKGRPPREVTTHTPFPSPKRRQSPALASGPRSLAEVYQLDPALRAFIASRNNPAWSIQARTA